MPNVIFRGGDYDLVEGKVASGQTIKPGHLVQHSAAGYRTHSVAAGSAAPSFAKERDMFGGSVDESIGAGEQLFTIHARRGCTLYARVAAGAGAIVRGDYLESAGNGTLRKVATAAATSEAARAGVIARAREAVDNSAGGAEAWLLIEVL
jgi:hypothetical protein